MPLVIVLAWWFLSWTPQYAAPRIPGVHGPFVTQAQCERIRTLVVKAKDSDVGPCLSDHD